MATRTATAESRAQELLEAHVRFEVRRLTVEGEATVAALVGDALDAVADHQVEDLFDRETVGRVLTSVVRSVPASALAGGLVELVTDVAMAGPEDPRPISEFADRDQVEALLDQLLALTPAYEKALDRLTESPLVGTLAARFMGRIVGEVVATNQEIANKVPGLGSLVSLGTSAANRVKGAADKQFEAVLGASVGKGGAFAVRKLNRILLETLRDPVTRDAMMQVWDLVAAEPLGGLDAHLTEEQAAALTGTVHEMALDLLGHEQVAVVVQTLVDGFFDRFGGYAPDELLEQLDLGRDEVVAHAVTLAPQALAVLHESGALERFVRARLAPFYASEGAHALLA